MKSIDNQIKDKKNSHTVINKWLAVAALFGFLYVSLSAFGAHFLANTLSAKAMITFGKGTKYIMFNCFSLTLCSFGLSLLPTEKRFNTAALLFMVGTLLFSGSLFAIVFSGVSMLGIITPIGGILQLSGWIVLISLTLKPRT